MDTIILFDRKNKNRMNKPEAKYYQDEFIVKYNSSMPIRILSDEVASQIAAGEVVERPASVVKELIENAIDAEAGHITIAIEGAGQTVIEISDDGMGIHPDDLPLALARHATSKLLSADDLFRIATLGFRGEALASIGSVSRLTLTSRLKNVETGFRLRVEGGRTEAPTPVGAPAGTVVRVENLFYNVPARRKFLKTERTERRQMDTLVTRYALAYPDIRFQLRQENRQSFQTSGNGDRREVLANIYGVEIAKKMIEVSSFGEGLEISGFISPTSFTRSNRSEIVFFVNGRPIHDSALSTALIQAYHTLLMVGRYPMAILFLGLPPEMVDVNVHPAKSEVRFRDRNLVFRGVGRASRKALLANTPIPEVDGVGAQIRWSPTWGRESIQRVGILDPAWEMANDKGEGIKGDLVNNLESVGQKTLPKVTIPLLRLVGQVASVYLVAEGPDGLYLIDQHAAHERVLFERMLQQKTTSIPIQSLLEAVTAEFSPANTRLLEEQLHYIQDLGFQVEIFGQNTFIIRGVPTLLSDMDPILALNALVEDFEEDEAPLGEEIEAKIIGRICKKAAVKAGQILSPEEQKALLSDLESCQSPRTCPHGRPTMIHLSVDLLARQFGRR
jgi:DNA mismatch repair protein MutL